MWGLGGWRCVGGDATNMAGSAGVAHPWQLGTQWVLVAPAPCGSRPPDPAVPTPGTASPAARHRVRRPDGSAWACRYHRGFVGDGANLMGAEGLAIWRRDAQHVATGSATYCTLLT